MNQSHCKGKYGEGILDWDSVTLGSGLGLQNAPPLTVSRAPDPAPGQGQTSVLGWKPVIGSSDNSRVQSYGGVVRKRGALASQPPGEARTPARQNLQGIQALAQLLSLHQSHPLPPIPRRLLPPRFLGGAGPAARAPDFP